MNLQTKMLNKEKNWLLNKLKEHYYLDYLIDDIVEIKGTLTGNTLFEDVYLSGFEITFQTKKGRLRVKSIDDLLQTFYDYRGFVNGQRFLTGDLFGDVFFIEILSLENFFYNQDLDDEFRKRLYNYYVDFGHDYATGEIRDILYNKHHIN
ncbi:hypothetical protein AAGG74_17615 [Bacillus mexicanus]|uniref:hypothetical protein n=1 Tax=Bacillus mexicanus TaxID=2834415 RepID=UPI003D24436B